MICVWWDWKGVIHLEMLKNNQNVNAQLYTEQMNRLSRAIQLKRSNRRDDVILQHDNARLHVATLTKNAIQDLAWVVLRHPPYFPDLAPSD